MGLVKANTFFSALCPLLSLKNKVAYRELDRIPPLGCFLLSCDRFHRGTRRIYFQGVGTG